MRVEVVYVAYDGKRFDSPAECKEYESQAMYCVNQFNRCYTLFDGNKDEIYLPAGMDIEEAIDWLNKIIGRCEYIKINEPLPFETFNFIELNIDYCLPTNKIGLYKYDYDRTEWVSAD